MKIIICGANGQLGSECRALSSEFKEYSFVFTDIEELNICDQQAVRAFLNMQKADVVINCAAFTAVDKAEREIEKAYQLNKDAARILAEECKANHSYLIHLSTDYVFDGNGQRPYLETDPTEPTSVYGKSKLAGEQEVIAAGGNAMIVRTSWLYSSFGNNFVKTMLRLARERGEVRVVNDQFGSPTYARDLAYALLSIAPKAKENIGVELYHYSNTGITNWCDFAKAIFELAEIPCTVYPVSTEEFPTPTRRPKYSVMDTHKFATHFQYEVPAWKDSLGHCIKLLK